MEQSNQIAFTLALGVLVALFFMIYNLLFKSSSDSAKSSSSETSAQQETEELTAKQGQQAKSSKKLSSKANGPTEKTTNGAGFKHKWIASILKSHSNQVTGIDFSSNGKYLLSTGLDRAVFLWSTKEFELKQHKSIRCNVEFDHAFKVRFSPDSRSFIAGLGTSNTIRAYKITKKEDSSIQILPAAIQDFPEKHKADLVNVGISCNGKFILTCSKDTIFNVWSTKGDILSTIDTKLMNNTYASISPCGRLIGVCGFTPDVKIWEVVFEKNGDTFKELRRAFELKGHTAGMYHFAFNSDSTRMASVSKDGTWKFWDTNIDFQRGQDARLLFSGNMETKGPSLIALSPDSYTIAVTNNKNLSFYNTLDGSLDQRIENICTETVSEIYFSNDNKYLAVATDRQVKVFYNITGHRVAIQDLKTKLKTAKTEAAKERIEQSIEEHQQVIDSVEQSNQ